MHEKLKILVIEAGHTEGQYWRDIWRYRELFYFLVWRDVLVSYKQTVFGIAWALIRPVTAVVVFTVLFDNLAELPSNGIPYPLLVFAGMLPWQFFSSALSASSESLISNSALVSKVYFPRIIIPGSAILGAFMDMLISGLLFVALMLWFGVFPDWRILALPAFFLLMLAGTIGAGLWFATMNVTYRDFRYIVPFAIQLGVYISPVGFLSDVVPEQWRLLYSINPMVGVIDGFRWAMFSGDVVLYWPGIALSTVLTLILLLTGINNFRKTERTFADVI